MMPRPSQDIEDKGSSTVTLSQYNKLTLCYVNKLIALNSNFLIKTYLIFTVGKKIQILYFSGASYLLTQTFLGL